MAIKNEELRVEGALQNLLAQNYPNLQIVIVDGDSKDNTIDIVRRYIRHSDVLLSQPDTPSMAKNIGIEYANGDLIFFHNCGDILYDGYLLGAVTYLNMSDRDFLYADIDLYQGGRRLSRCITPEFPENRVLYSMPFNNQTILFKKKMFERCRYDEDYYVANDHNFMIRAIKLYGFRGIKYDVSAMRYEVGGLSQRLEGTAHFEILKSSLLIGEKRTRAIIHYLSMMFRYCLRKVKNTIKYPIHT